MNWFKSNNKQVAPALETHVVPTPDQIVSDRNTTIKFIPAFFTIDGTIEINGSGDYEPKFNALRITDSAKYEYKKIDESGIAQLLNPAAPTVSGGNNRSKTRRNNTRRQKKHRGRSRKHIK